MMATQLMVMMVLIVEMVVVIMVMPLYECKFVASLDLILNMPGRRSPTPYASLQGPTAGMISDSCQAYLG